VIFSRILQAEQETEGVQLDPLLRLAADERANRARAAKNISILKRRDPISEVLGSHFYWTDHPLMFVRRRVFAKFSRVYPHLHIALDFIPIEKIEKPKDLTGDEQKDRRLMEKARIEAAEKAIKRVAWRGEVARANGYRWVPLGQGLRFSADELKEKAGIR
jgi:hypothetical protein